MRKELQLMNEECTVFENQDEGADVPHDFVATPPAPPTEGSLPQGEETPLGEPNEAAPDIFADTGADTDFDCEGSDPSHQKSELDELRGQLNALRQELDSRNARLAQMEEIERQYAEFSALYPDTPISAISREVWQGVTEGNSLAAAFALAEHRTQLSQKRAAESNAQNRARSAGAANNAESVEFSPAEVRAMTSAEVRANLSKIMRSMQKWH
jgi:hypothetical protein